MNKVSQLTRVDTAPVGTARGACSGRFRRAALTRGVVGAPASHRAPRRTYAAQAQRSVGDVRGRAGAPTHLRATSDHAFHRPKTRSVLVPGSPGAKTFAAIPATWSMYSLNS